ncbi:MAG: SDR family oxidoreductase [Ruminiclostridium sp.]|nr:SDR family oxidoreductase [Ruminiclostridium sp.]
MNFNEKVLKDKVAVVTGAGRGIGKAIAIAYAMAGANIVCAARTVKEIEETAKEISDKGGRALAVKTDVTRTKSVNNMFERAVEHFGGVDILVINAGANYDRKTIENSNLDDWKRTIDINLFGAYYCAHSVIPFLKQRGTGKIITIGSGLAHRGYAGGSAYSCSKAGLWMLTRILAQELMEYKISVNELIPGPVQTSIDSNAGTSDSKVKAMESEWEKQPEDVIPLALFLAGQPDIGPTAQSFSLMRRDN